MYEAFFGLTRRPFSPVPNPEQYFPADSIEAARQTLLRTLQRGEGAGLLIGPSGTGKTLLCQVLDVQLQSTLAVVLLCSGRLSTRSALYQTILHGLQRPYRDMDEGELRLALVDALTASKDQPKALILLVDEAHTLPLRLLDEIRMLTNLANSGEPRVRVILAGSHALEERFASPKLESFSQRIVARCYLETFNREETQQYVRAQIDAAGGDGLKVFTTEATVAAYQATDGVPRLVNQLCDHAMLLAYADGDTTIDAMRVETAWADLQQLPAPWCGDETAGSAPDVIEFGRLEDEPLADEALPVAESAAMELPAEDEGPDAQVERIERTLSELEGDGPADESEEDAFQPAGTIGPEMELVFDESPHPLAESFDEEEEIVHRYRDATPPKSIETPVPSTVVVSQAATTPESEEAQTTADDLIVVEKETEEEDTDGWERPSRVVSDSKHEYRRLFAKMRQS